MSEGNGHPWPTAPLGKCCSIISGSTPRRDSPEFWDGDIVWATPKDLSELDGIVLTETNDRITEAGLKSCSTNMLPEGAVLFSSRAPIGLVAIAGVPMCTNQGFKNLVPGDNVDSRYLYWTMRRLAPRIQDLGNGATFKEVSKSVIERVEIPLPKLEEQKRIAAILDKADAIRRQRQEAAILSQSLRRAAFYDLFGDPKDNSHGWESKTLGEVSHGRLRNGVSPSRSGDYVGSVLVLSAITGDRFDASCVKEGTFASAFTESQLVNEDDFLICRGNGNIQLVARAAFPTSVIEHCVFPDTMIAATVDPHLLEKEYLEEVWRTAFVRQQVESGARTTNGTHKVNQGLLEKVSFPIPPIPLQQRFGAICRRCEALREKFSDDADSDLFNSLVQRAFKGEL